MPTVYRHPEEESCDLYPGLCVHDDRMTGSITAGRTRLPLWAFVQTAVAENWEVVLETWHIDEAGIDEGRFAGFLYNLLESRGEFGRLLLVLADVHRRAIEVPELYEPWWRNAEQRGRVEAHLERCLAALRTDDGAEAHLATG